MYHGLSGLVTFWLMGASTFAQLAPRPAIRTTVCEIAKHPEQFGGKLVQVRAQVWSDFEKYWIYESLTDSLQLEKSCGWLPAQFTYATNLQGNIAFGTFTGTVVVDPRLLGQKAHLHLVIERQEDISGRVVQIGVPSSPKSSWMPILYDRSSGRFFFGPE